MATLLNEHERARLKRRSIVVLLLIEMGAGSCFSASGHCTRRTAEERTVEKNAVIVIMVVAIQSSIVHVGRALFLSRHNLGKGDEGRHTYIYIYILVFRAWLHWLNR